MVVKPKYIPLVLYPSTNISSDRNHFYVKAYSKSKRTHIIFTCYVYQRKKGLLRRRKGVPACLAVIKWACVQVCVYVLGGDEDKKDNNKVFLSSYLTGRQSWRPPQSSAPARALRRLPP